MSIRDLVRDALLADQLEKVDELVTSIHPMVILDEVEAMLQLLETFGADPDRAVSVAALSIIKLAQQRTIKLAQQRTETWKRLKS